MSELYLLEFSRRIMELYQVSFENGHDFDDRPFTVLLGLVYRTYTSQHPDKYEALSRYPLTQLLEDVYNEVDAGYAIRPFYVTNLMVRTELIRHMLTYT